jgi:hypothetical protein
MSAVVFATDAAVRANAAVFSRLLPDPQMHSRTQGRGPAVLLLKGIGASRACSAQRPAHIDASTIIDVWPPNRLGGRRAAKWVWQRGADGAGYELRAQSGETA